MEGGRCYGLESIRETGAYNKFDQISVTRDIATMVPTIYIYPLSYITWITSVSFIKESQYDDLGLYEYGCILSFIQDCRADLRSKKMYRRRRNTNDNLYIELEFVCCVDL